MNATLAFVGIILIVLLTTAAVVVVLEVTGSLGFTFLALVAGMVVLFVFGHLVAAPVFDEECRRGAPVPPPGFQLESTRAGCVLKPARVEP